MNQPTICSTCGDPKNNDGALHCWRCRNGQSRYRATPLSQSARLEWARLQASKRTNAAPELDTFNRTQLTTP